MPLYEYQCSQCGAVFEVRQKFSDDPLTQHEGCGGAVEKLLSAPAFQLKGSGWYVTDYGSGGSRGGAIAASKADSGAPATTTSETKSESKPAETKSTPTPAPSTSTKSDS
jgi:putative FmdB family regulatory protein